MSASPPPDSQLAAPLHISDGTRCGQCFAAMLGYNGIGTASGFHSNIDCPAIHAKAHIFCSDQCYTHHLAEQHANRSDLNLLARKHSGSLRPLTFPLASQACGNCTAYVYNLHNHFDLTHKIRSAHSMTPPLTQEDRSSESDMAVVAATAAASSSPPPPPPLPEPTQTYAVSSLLPILQAAMRSPMRSPRRLLTPPPVIAVAMAAAAEAATETSAHSTVSAEELRAWMVRMEQRLEQHHHELLRVVRGLAPHT